MRTLPSSAMHIFSSAIIPHQHRAEGRYKRIVRWDKTHRTKIAMYVAFCVDVGQSTSSLVHHFQKIRIRLTARILENVSVAIVGSDNCGECDSSDDTDACQTGAICSWSWPTVNRISWSMRTIWIICFLKSGWFISGRNIPHLFVLYLRGQAGLWMPWLRPTHVQWHDIQDRSQERTNRQRVLVGEWNISFVDVSITCVCNKTTGFGDEYTSELGGRGWTLSIWANSRRVDTDLDGLGQP